MYLQLSAAITTIRFQNISIPPKKPRARQRSLSCPSLWPWPLQACGRACHCSPGHMALVSAPSLRIVSAGVTPVGAAGGAHPLHGAPSWVRSGVRQWTSGSPVAFMGSAAVKACVCVGVRSHAPQVDSGGSAGPRGSSGLNFKNCQTGFQGAASLSTCTGSVWLPGRLCPIALVLVCAARHSQPSGRSSGSSAFPGSWLYSPSRKGVLTGVLNENLEKAFGSEHIIFLPTAHFPAAGAFVLYERYFLLDAGNSCECTCSPLLTCYLVAFVNPPPRPD